MIKAYFDFDIFGQGSINNIPLIMPFSIIDRLDGLCDTISFEFVTDLNLLDLFYIGKKCEIKIYSDSELIKSYRMCLTDMSRQINTVYYDNVSPKYKYTVTASEPTILIQNSIRTNITISPDEYENNAYPTLYEAFEKILSCHNMCNRNEIVHCGFVREQEVKYDEPLNISDIIDVNNDLYLNGEFTLKPFTINNVTFLEKKFSFNNVKLPYTETVIFATNPAGRRTLVLDFTFSVSQATKKMNVLITPSKLNNISAPSKFDSEYSLSIYGYNKDGKKIYDLLSKIACPSLTYVDLSTFSQLSDIFDRVGAIPYLTFDRNGRCYVEYYLKRGESENIRVINQLVNEEISINSDSNSPTINSQVLNLQCDTENIFYPSWCSAPIIENKSLLDQGLEIEISIPSQFIDFQVGTDYDFYDDFISTRRINFLVPNSFNQNQESVNGANTYNATLPNNIDRILNIYWVSDIISDEDSGETRFKIKKISNSKFVEKSVHDILPDLEKATYAYFKRGENTIYQPISLLAKKSDLQGDWKWSDKNLYKILRQCRFFVEYKPMLDLEYTNYDYNNLNSTVTKTIDVPFRFTSDKQATSVLNYELDKNLSAQISYKFISSDPNLLTFFAGEKVLYKNKFLPSSKYVGEFETEYDLISFSGNLSDGDWGKINDDEYIWYSKSNRWEKYSGEPCVITSINYSVNSKTIEMSCLLSNKVASSSSLSDYSDDVRVSNNLSTENDVYRGVNYYKTFLLNATANYSSFTSNALLDKFSFGKNDGFIPTAGMCDFINVPSRIKSDLIDKYDVFSTFGSYCEGSNLSFVKNSFDSTWNKQLYTVTRKGLIATAELGASIDLTISVNGEFAFPLTFEYDSSRRIVAKNIARIRRTELSWNIFDREQTTFVDRFLPPYNEIKELLDYEIEHNIKYQFAYIDAGKDKVAIGYRISGSDDDFTKVKNSTFKIPKAKYVPYTEILLEPLYVDRAEVISFTPEEVAAFQSGDSRSSSMFVVVNQNNTFNSSNNFLKVVSNYSGPSSLGTFAEGLEEDNMFSYVSPLYYKTSGDLSKIGGFCNSASIRDTDGEYYKISDTLLRGGFSDRKIDIREVPTVSAQYMIVPNNTYDFLQKNNLFNYEGFYFSDDAPIYEIDEINTINFDWLNASKILNKSATKSLKVCKVPNHYRLSDCKKEDLEIYSDVNVEITSTDLSKKYGMYDILLNLNFNFSLDLSNKYVFFADDIPIMSIKNTTNPYPGKIVRLTTFLV